MGLARQDVLQLGGRSFVEFRDEFLLPRKHVVEVLITGNALRNANKNTVSDFACQTLLHDVHSRLPCAAAVAAADSDPITDQFDLAAAFARDQALP